MTLKKPLINRGSSPILALSAKKKKECLAFYQKFASYTKLKNMLLNTNFKDCVFMTHFQIIE